MRKGWILALAPALMALSACNSSGQPDAAALSGSSSVGDVKPANPTGTDTTTPTNGNGFTSCVSSSPDQICIGVKFMSYADTSSQVVVDQANAQRVIQAANNIWKQCNVQFQIEDYEAIDPSKYGLGNGTAVQSQLGQIRQTFSDQSQFLVVLTDSWQSNYLGWTEMPGGAPYGSIVDGSWVMSNGLSGEVAVAHELGHYQGLDHVSDSGDLMYPAAVASATTLTSDQCALARSTDQQYWAAMQRH